MGNTLYCIYTITDPIENTIVYVGQAKDFNSRVSSYKYNCGNHKIAVWIDKIRAIGYEPIIEVLDEIPDCYKGFDKQFLYDFLYDLERYWIKQLKAWGFLLLNVHNYTISDYHKDLVKRTLVKKEAKRLNIKPPIKH